SHEIDALLRLALIMAINLRAADHAICKVRCRALFRAKEAPGIVAESTVPLLPTVPDKAADLVKAGSIPGLGYKLRSGERGIRFDIPKNRWVGEWLTRLTARKDRCQIEPEPVYMHHLNPVTKAVQNHPADNRLIGVERVSTAGKVGVTAVP